MLARIRLVTPSQGLAISTNDPHPKPPWLLTAEIQSERAVKTFAALSFFRSPVTSTIRLRNSPARCDDGSQGGVRLGWFYSCRSAETGSIRAARRAG